MLQVADQVFVMGPDGGRGLEDSVLVHKDGDDGGADADADTGQDTEADTDTDTRGGARVLASGTYEELLAGGHMVKQSCART